MVGGGRYTIVRTWREPLPYPVNTYILEAGGETVVVDAGAEPGAETLLRHLAGRQAIVLVTHYHWDHSVGIVGLLRAGHRVYAPEETLHLLRSPEAVAERIGLIARMAGLDPSPLQEYLGEYYDGVFEAAASASSLGSGPVVGVEALPCPGHTWDHHCYLVNGMLFTGDLVSPTGSTETLDVEAYLETIDTVLSRRDWSILLPGHGEPMARSVASEKLLAARRRKLTRYRRLVKLLRGTSAVRADKLLVMLYGGEPRDPFTAFDRAYSLLGYLNPLVRRGVVELVEKTDGVWVRVVEDPAEASL